jgi:ABC-type multidrug transport system ATPase subunit
MSVVTSDMPALTQKKWTRRIRVNLFITQKVCYKRGIRHTAANATNALLILDDIHIPTLTVGQTLKFALSTKTPGPKGRLPGISRSEFNAAVKDMLLKMLNIVHTESTLVGDSFVRGVSGGERKRVSIAEMMTTRARVQCWDNSSRGLDASTALDFVRSLRIMTDVLGQTTFTTL